MRHIGTLSDEEQARRFEGYALTRGVKTQVEPEDGVWAVWVYEEDQVEQARQELEGFVRNPDDPIYDQGARAASRIRREQQRAEELARKRYVDVRRHWDRPLTSRCPVMLVLMAVSIFVAVATRLGEQHEPVITSLAIASFEIEGNRIRWEGLQDIRQGQVWRLVTPIFVHFGPLHIIFNMLMLYFLGAPVESRRGSRRFLVFVLCAAVLSNISQYGMNRLLGGSPLFGGMSGVLYGLFGYLWMKSRFEPESGFFMPPSTVFILMGWFLLGVIGAIPRMANTAHGVGLVVGLVVGYAPVWWRSIRR